MAPADADQEGTLPFRWPDFSREREIRLTEALSEEILAVYEEENRSPDEHLPHLNLDEYRYY
jgi:hypothetical protein